MSKQDHTKPATAIAIVSNEMTPYRLHQLERLRDGLEGVRVINIFTHSIHGNSMPWKIEIGSDLGIVFDEANRLERPGQFMNRRSLALYRSIRDTIDREGVRMVVMLGYNDLPRLLLIRHLRRKGVPIVFTADSNIFGDARVQGVKRLVKGAFMRWLLRNVDGLMPMGTCGRAYFRSYLDHDLPEFIVPYEPDYAALATRDEAGVASFRAKHGLREGRRRFMYCGRFVEVKRVDVLLRAFVAMAPSHPEWDLVLAGDGPLREQLVAMIPPALRDRVTFTGFLQFDDISRCYHACDALVLPSEYEPWALVVTEAMAAGMAVIASDVVGAAVDLVRPGVNGYLVTPRSVDSLESALRRAASPGAIDALKRKAPAILASWREATDPVAGFEAAIARFTRSS
jgi:glycosyltransferase involved in cell wall biosynthesis